MISLWLKTKIRLEAWTPLGTSVPKLAVPTQPPDPSYATGTATFFYFFAHLTFSHAIDLAHVWRRHDWRTRCRRASVRDLMKYSTEATIIERPRPLMRM